MARTNCLTDRCCMGLRRTNLSLMTPSSTPTMMPLDLKGMPKNSTSPQLILHVALRAVRDIRPLVEPILSECAALRCAQLTRMLCTDMFPEFPTSTRLVTMPATHSNNQGYASCSGPTMSPHRASRTDLTVLDGSLDQPLGCRTLTALMIGVVSAPPQNCMMVLYNSMVAGSWPDFKLMYSSQNPNSSRCWLHASRIPSIVYFLRRDVL